MSASIRMKLEGWQELEIKLRTIFKRTNQMVEEVNEQFAEALLDEVRSRIVALDIVETGGYRDSWYVSRINNTGVTVATDRPDANRHEFGFVGRDSLGRYYAAPPRPHFRPAIEKVGPEWRDGLAKGIEYLWTL